MALHNYVGPNRLSEILTNIKTWVTNQLSRKMNFDGSNAGTNVIFANVNSFTVGRRKIRSTVGAGSVAEGNYTEASGIYSHSEGNSSVASNDTAHAEGSSTVASGFASHAEGSSSAASGLYDHAEGYGTVASGGACHAEGFQSKATHEISHAEGWNTKTGATCQHVQGKYNVGRTNTLMEVGNGTDDSRSNAFEVYNDGSLSTDNGNTKVKLEDLMSKGSGETYTFHITNTVASNSGVAWCNKVAKFSAPSRAETGVEFTFSVTVRVGENVGSLAFDSDLVITSIYLFDKATVKINNLAAANYTYTAAVNSDKDIVLTFTIAAATVTAANATALNAVIDSVSPGFCCLYANSKLALTGTITGNGIVEKIPGFASVFNTFPSADHITQHVGDFYFPTGSPRWNLEIEVDPGTAYYAICYLENTTTGAYFNHSICYAGVGVPTIAAPTVAPAPVAGKVMAFVGTTWTPFAAGVAGVVTDGVVTTKPRLRIQGYHSNNAPTAGLGMHMRLFRIY